MSSPAPRLNGRLLIVLLAALVSLGPVATDLYLPALPAITKAFGTNEAGGQTTLSTFLLGFAISQLLYGPMIDRFGRRRLMIGALTLGIAATFACAFAPTIGAFASFRFIQALGLCAGSIVGRAIVRDLADNSPDGRTLAARRMTALSSIAALTPAAAPIIGGKVFAAFGWQAVFFTMTGLELVLLFVLIRVLPETRPQPDRHALKPARLLTNARTILKHPLWQRGAAIYTFAYSLMFCFITGSSFTLITVLKADETEYGVAFATALIGYVIGTRANALLLRHLRLTRLIATGASIATAAGLVMAGLACAGVETMSAVMIPVFVSMIGCGMILANAMTTAIMPFPETAGFATSLTSFIQMLTSTVASTLIGILFDGTTRAMAGMLAIMGVATLVAALTLPERRRIAA